jgi:polysaccharide export outer membrane protein
MPLETVIRAPRQNVILQPDDVMTVLFQPFSFVALGATGRMRKSRWKPPVSI